MKKIYTALVLIACYSNLFAQYPTNGSRPSSAMPSNMNIGRFYGKIVETKSNKPIDGAAVLLTGNKYDTVTKKMLQNIVLATVITQPNGDFSLENLPVMGNFKLKVTALGFKTINQTVTFGLNAQSARGGNIAALVDKDLGNISLEEDPNSLDAVTVTSTTKQLFEMGVDRKIFNVDKNIVSTGQTATEIMKNIPSLNVDIDGNVTLRNAAPQLFVDGRPTTLTLDQIPADIVEKVELITNPSAKFDASGGNAGILNVVLKKNKKVGYNGGIRTGIDSRGRINLGGDINVRQNKINTFLSGSFNQRRSLSWSKTNRDNFTNPKSNILQNSEGQSNGYFGFIRGGFDYLIDNRNTLSLALNYNRGNFANEEDQRIDSSVNNNFISYSDRITNSEMNFRNFGSQLSFKHNFAKTGHEWTADVNFNSSRNNSEGYFNTQTYFPNTSPKGQALLQQTFTNGTNKFFTLQTDYENPLTPDSKFESGARIAIRNFSSNNQQFFYNYSSGRYEQIPTLSANYQFTDAVYAAYAIYSFKKSNWSYQLGLRAERSNYEGKLLGKDSTFNVQFPLSLFPSAFVSYKITETQDLQFNYTRRINRPNFFQLIPFIDYSDPQNLNVGNPGLKPEFTNSLEASYNYAYKKGANFLVSIFYKQNENLITRFQYKDVSPIAGIDSSVFNTYANANSSQLYGIELTNRMPITKTWDLTVNVNLFNSKINGNNIQQNLTNERVSWFTKINNNIKFKKGWSLQLSADYQAKTVLPQEGGRGGGGRGGMMWGGGVQSSAQGFILPRYSFDIAIRKDWQWKNGRSGSLTLSMNDFARTQLFQSTALSPFFYQESERRRDPQVLRLNFNYRFGKFDPNLFKRKNTKAGDGSGEMMSM